LSSCARSERAPRERSERRSCPAQPCPCRAPPAPRARDSCATAPAGPRHGSCACFPQRGLGCRKSVGELGLAGTAARVWTPRPHLLSWPLVTLLQHGAVGSSGDLPRDSQDRCAARRHHSGEETPACPNTHSHRSLRRWVSRACGEGAPYPYSGIRAIVLPICSASSTTSLPQQRTYTEPPQWISRRSMAPRPAGRFRSLRHTSSTGPV
jgi:hypothetical protein